VYEGSAVNINYVSGGGRIETMSLSRRAVREGSTALIVDDFMRDGGTARGMLSLLSEFNVHCCGACFVFATETSSVSLPVPTRALMLLDEIRIDEPLQVRAADWII
jgi:purine operon repressor